MSEFAGVCVDHINQDIAIDRNHVMVTIRLKYLTDIHLGPFVYRDIVGVGFVISITINGANNEEFGGVRFNHYCRRTIAIYRYVAIYRYAISTIKSNAYDITPIIDNSRFQLYFNR